MLLEKWDFFVFPTITGEIVSIEVDSRSEDPAVTE
jgi:hypothetical protein